MNFLAHLLEENICISIQISLRLTHWGQVMHICIGKLGLNVFEQWAVYCIQWNLIEKPSPIVIFNAGGKINKFCADHASKIKQVVYFWRHFDR